MFCLRSSLANGLKFAIIVILSFFASPGLQSEETVKGAPNVFIERSESMDYIKENCKFVNYVRDRDDADVFIQVFYRSSGGSGTEYTIDFNGKGKFAGVDDTIRFYTDANYTEDMEREKLLKYLQLGMVKYLLKSPLAERLSVTYEDGGEGGDDVSGDLDEWDAWVFRISSNGYFNGDKNSTYTNLYSSISAARITESLKFRFSFSNSYSENKTIYEDDEYFSFTRSNNVYSSIIKSLDSNWSYGLWARAYRSTYSNIELGLSLYPGLEYNFFPYSESSRRQLRLTYQLIAAHNSYTEETIYLKTNEYLFSHDLSLSLDLIRQWGSLSVSLSGSNYFHDFSKNYFNLYGDLSVKIIGGLSLNLYGSFSSIHNQLSIAKSEATLDEVLLLRRELETQYSYYGSAGLSYTFGSIYNNVVNPRFGE